MLFVCGVVCYGSLLLVVGCSCLCVLVIVWSCMLLFVIASSCFFYGLSVFLYG